MYVIVDHRNLTDVKVLRGDDGCTKGFKRKKEAIQYARIYVEDSLRYENFTVIKV